MLRGQFTRGDGLVVANSITEYGARVMLRAVLRNEAFSLFAALVNCVPDPAIALESLAEPTIGVGGYARIPLARTALGWPDTGTLNGESWLESLPMLWTATGIGFDKPVNRIALIYDAADILGEGVIALSGAFPAPITVLPTTPAGLRQYRYKLFLR